MLNYDTAKNFIVFDLEFNQAFRINKVTKQLEQGNMNPQIPQEIIEIGAVKLDENYCHLDSFRIFIKPAVYKKIHPHVKKMTKISEYELEYALPFQQCLLEFQRWIEMSYYLCTWSRDDIAGLRNNCIFYGFDIDWIDNIIDVQKLYSDVNNLKQQVALKNAVKELAIESETRFHSALNDAIYTSKVLQYLILKKKGSDKLWQT